MPHIIVTADRTAEDGQPLVMFRERVSVSDFESRHFATQLLERLGWAVGDADEVNHRSALAAERRRAHQRAVDATRRELSAVQRPPRSASVVTTAS